MTTSLAETHSRVSAARHLTVLGLVFLAAAASLLAEPLATSDRPTVGVIWGSLALVLYAAGLLCLTGGSQWAGLGLSRWKLGPWILLWYGIVFGITTLTWDQPQTGLATEIAISSVLRALWVVGIGMTAWSLGYLIGPGQPARRLAARAMGKLGKRFTTEVRSRATPWVLYAIGIGATIFIALTTGQFGFTGDVGSASTLTGYTQILNDLSQCAPLAIAAAALQVFRERLRTARITLAILFPLQLAVGAGAGVKSSFVIAALAMAIPFASARRRLPKTALSALVAVFLLVVIPFNQPYREYSRGTPVRQDVAAAPGILNQAVTSQNVTTALPQSVDYLAQRIPEVDNVAIIVQRTPGQIKFLGPLVLVEEPLAGLVPRAIWPGKPRFVTGTEVTEDFYDLPAGTSSSDTLIGGLYWYDGLITVVIGMFLFGSGVRLLDDVLDVRFNPHAIFLVLLLFPSWVGAEEDWLSIISSIPTTLIIWLVAVALTFRVRKRV